MIKTQRLIFKSITLKTAKSNPFLVDANISGIRSYRFLIYVNQFKVINDGIDLIQNLGVSKILKVELISICYNMFPVSSIKSITYRKSKP